jgi:MoaA/NifB/PqqE/SkfB family radical SAM enzyme
MGEQYSANQVLGRTRTIGCVAVEITQRCNLNCSLCYLSEHSESVQDLPIEEVFRRLDGVVEHYGQGTHVQITGGDPTLRKHKELIAIVRYASGIGLFPALFTNGIAASRSLLEKLADAGLSDIAFHVDTTQRRHGYSTESDLNAIREDYIERARGLGLMVIFNTTVHKDNFRELPGLVGFFVENADVIGFVSFQLQADTGRGEWRQRDAIINQTTVREQIEAAAGKTLPWDVVRLGHQHCHSYMPTMVVNGQVYPVIEDASLFSHFLKDFQAVQADRHASLSKLLSDYGLAVLQKPFWIVRLATYLACQASSMWRDLIRGKGQVRKLSFFIQNFMDQAELQQERIDACSFMVMTADGPLSMCEHNARRDEFILKPIKVRKADGTVVHFQPLPTQQQRKEAVG